MTSSVLRPKCLLSTFVVIVLLLLVWCYRPRLNVPILDLTEADVLVETIPTFTAPVTQCQLQPRDPWDPTIVPFLDPSEDPMRNCRPSLEPLTDIVDGRLMVLRKGLEQRCYQRCLRPFNDYRIAIDEWQPVRNGSEVPCDVLEVRCLKSGFWNLFTSGKPIEERPAFYHFVHSHVYRPNRVAEEIDRNDTKPPPDVHFLVFDSVSMPQFVRSMPRTAHVLREHFDAFSFPHLNKVGLNSRPNGYAFLMGKRVNEISRSPVSVGHPSDYQNSSSCHRYLDDDQFIGFRFQDAGYVTLMSEDYSFGLFDGPFCVAFERPPADHYMRPFQLRLQANFSDAKTLLDWTHRKSCRESFMPQMDYLQSFVDNYPDRPKFSVSWMTELAHENVNGLYHVDKYFSNFFKRNQKKFANSFLFIMGDHGLRFGKVRTVPAAEEEDNNPFFMLAVPEALRKNNTQMEILRRNSKRHISQFDTYATLVGLTEPENPRTPKPLLHGHSYLRELPDNRTCDSMGIPFEYCLCRPKTTRLPADDPRIPPILKALIDYLNSELAKNIESRSLCSRLQVNPEFLPIVNEFDLQNNSTIFYTKLHTIPGTGEFAAFVGQERQNGSFYVLSAKVSRHNLYKWEASCAIKTPAAPYCMCKDQL